MREVDRMLLAAYKDERWLIDYCKSRGNCLWDWNGEVFNLLRKWDPFPQKAFFMSTFERFESYSVAERRNILDSVMHIVEGVKGVYPLVYIRWSKDKVSVYNNGAISVYNNGVIHVRSFTHKKWERVFVNKDEKGLDGIVREVIAYADREERMLRWAVKKAEEYGFETVSYTQWRICVDKITYLQLYSGGTGYLDLLAEWRLPKLMRMGYKEVEIKIAELAVKLV